MAQGVVIGAGAMYLLDREQGRRRRAHLRDQVVRLAHRTENGSQRALRDLRNRGVGILAEARSKLRRGSAPDTVVEARVRTRLGRVASHPGGIAVMVSGGNVTLTGPVLAAEEKVVLSCVGRVKGVRGVENRLTVHSDPSGVPGLQGTPRRRGDRPEILQENWSPGIRMLAGMAGAGLAIRGATRDGVIGMGMLGLGMGILSRSLANLPVRRLTGVDAGRRAIDVQKILTVNAPIREVFDFWADFENLPRFMEHLEEVRSMGPNRYRWVARGPAGLSLAWVAETTLFRDCEVIAWKSLGSTPVANAGIVRFQPIGDGSTRIDVRMSYNPPAGAIGHVVASILGVDPKHAMDEDLVRFKSLLENGKTTADGREVVRGEEERGESVPLDPASH